MLLTLSTQKLLNGSGQIVTHKGLIKKMFRLIDLKNVKTTVCEPATDAALNQGTQLQVAGLMSRHSAAWRRYSQCVLSNWLQTRDTERRMSLCHVTSIS